MATNTCIRTSNSGTVPHQHSDHIRKKHVVRNTSGGVPGMCPGEKYSLRLKPNCGIPGNVTCVSVEEVKCKDLADNRGSVFRLVVHDTTVHSIGHDSQWHDKNTISDTSSKVHKHANAKALHFHTDGSQLNNTGCPITQLSSIRPAPNGKLGALITFDSNGKCLTLYATLVPESNCCADSCNSVAATGWSGPQAGDACGCSASCGCDDSSNDDSSGGSGAAEEAA